MLVFPSPSRAVLNKSQLSVSPEPECAVLLPFVGPGWLCGAASNNGRGSIP